MTSQNPAYRGLVIRALAPGNQSILEISIATGLGNQVARRAVLALIDDGMAHKSGNRARTDLFSLGVAPDDDADDIVVQRAPEGPAKRDWLVAAFFGEYSAAATDSR